MFKISYAWYIGFYQIELPDPVRQIVQWGKKEKKRKRF